MLPQAQLTPLCYDERALSEIQYLPAMRAVEEYQQTVAGYQEALAAVGRSAEFASLSSQSTIIVLGKFLRRI